MMDLHRFPILPLDGEGVRRLPDGRGESLFIRIKLAPTPSAGHTPGTSPIKGEDS